MSGILLLDRGNHSLKAVLAEYGQFTKRWREGSGDCEGPIAEILDSSSPDGIAYSSVVPKWTSALRSELARRGIQTVLEAGSGARLPFALLVDQPEMLGADRICAACGAFSRGTREAVIVDAGTAVTVDVLTSGGFIGGAIFPGIDLLLASLHSGTGALPHVSNIDPKVRPPGRNTEDAMAAGAVWGMIGAVKELVSRSMESLTQDARILLTGGSAGVLERYLEGPVEVDPDLVFHGLLLLFETNI